MQRLYTAAGEALRGVPWQAYPRPQMERAEWLNLNGEWEIEANGRKSAIRVPFCPESLLSGFQGKIVYGQPLLYRRRFLVPDTWQGKRVLLHFGAVSRHAEVSVNGHPAVTHENGYLPFSADITDFLTAGENQLTVTAINDLSPRYPWGKQRKKRGGMWYTPVSGIWQTVWLEPVASQHISTLSIQTGENWAQITAQGVSEGTVKLDGQEYPLRNGQCKIVLSQPRLWSPENPFLYRFTVEAGKDQVCSYFALRTLTVEQVGGFKRLCLNGKPYFFHGLLDQGYWSDGLYTPADPEGYERDILAMKALGFNTLRKHIKIEPQRFYYDCDRLGMIVFQDMVNCGPYRYLRDTALPTLGFQKKRDTRLTRDRDTRRHFLAAMEETVSLLSPHPSICLWTIFNEGWGQFQADECCRRLKAWDPSRFVDATSGWFSQKESDVESLHIYFQDLHVGNGNKAQLLSEIGGWCLKYPEHSFNTEKTYGYRKYDTREQFVSDLRALYLNQVLPLISQGLCGTIYTQVSDVEDETNGLMTFDRKIIKLAPQDLLDIAGLLSEAMGALPS